MGLGSSDLERLANDIDKERIILRSIYCGRCGYNLRTLPTVYKCPECGTPYSARARKIKGIFNPYAIDFPWRDLLTTIFSAAATVMLGLPAAIGGGRKILALAMAVFFLVFAFISGQAAYAGILRYCKASGILSRIQRDEDAER